MRNIPVKSIQKILFYKLKLLVSFQYIQKGKPSLKREKLIQQEEQEWMEEFVKAYYFITFLYILVYKKKKKIESLYFLSSYRMKDLPFVVSYLPYWNERLTIPKVC